ncbi:hypothetical protein PH5382_02465 [Phaeobacter sp. CECT 5382]|uniref:hypothetical protein n=1 Tax=Phaeobacter sp. CECT 5382 TaxID=1712645 RepID=UPI0006DB4DFF|nr:hypothetical protein [Phaeobacter sp. CECT 5382]CUH88529.1 hypothetical protein PH5382_02465 [Phaeobacter sp. CECT 5382]
MDRINASLKSSKYVLVTSSTLNPKFLEYSFQPKVTGAKRGWFSLPHMHKSHLDFLETDIQAVKRGFLPSSSAVSPEQPFLASHLKCLTHCVRKNEEAGQRNVSIE